MRAEKPREIAVRVLSRHAETGRWLDDLLAEEFDRTRLSPVDRALATELVLGSTRHQAVLDWLIGRRTDGREQPRALVSLLRIGLHQLFHLDRIPDHAAVNESVELARTLGMGEQAGFVNAVLRGCLRERDKLEKDLAELKESQPHLGYSHPGWLCRRWEERLGPTQLRELLVWNNQRPRLFLRANSLRIAPGELPARLAADGAECAPASFDWVPEGWAIELTQHPSLSSMSSFRDGLFYIQDPSTLLAVRELGAEPGESVLDFCAAPGGKTTAIAELMRNEGRITAFDPDPGRRRLIRENCERLGTSIVRVPEGRPVRPGEQFDRILIDAPCSNTGVMRRRAELRWRITAAEIERLRGVQLSLLRQASGWLKPGGTLVYSTCSLESEENEATVRAYLEGAPAWTLIRERQLSPLVERVDGAYVAVLTREK